MNTLDRCKSHGLTCQEIPKDVDKVLRAWFPVMHYGGLEWKEASVSYGGALFAAHFLLRDRRWDGRRPLAFAYWPDPEPSGEVGGWQMYQTLPGDTSEVFLQLLLNRQAAARSRRANRVIEEAGLRLERAEIQRTKDLIANLMKCLPWVSKESELCLAVADFRRRRGIAQAMGRQLIPFVPIDVGEVHNVVPVGEIVNRCRDIIEDQEWKDRFQFWKYLANIFSTRHDRLKLMRRLGVEDSENVLDWPIDSPIGDYEGGWTFVLLEDQDPGLHQIPVDFLTLEPEYPLCPFGQSLSGAMAASLCWYGFHQEPNCTIELRGQRLTNDKLWTASAFKRLVADLTGDPWQKTIAVSRQGDEYRMIVPVRYLGTHTVEDIEFTRRGLE